MTGGSRGIGEALVYDLASRGAKVATTYSSDRSAEAVERLKQRIESETASTIVGIQCDLSRVESPQYIVDETIKAFGKDIDILVNNAAILTHHPIGTITPEHFDETYHLNVRAPLLMVQAVMPHLKRPGRIINVSSVGARLGIDNTGLYSSSKAAIEGLTRNWAWELGKDGTTVNAVCPGPVRSEMLDSMPKETIDGQMAMTAVERRTGLPEEVAEIVG